MGEVVMDRPVDDRSTDPLLLFLLPPTPWPSTHPRIHSFIHSSIHSSTTHRPRLDAKGRDGAGPTGGGHLHGGLRGRGGGEGHARVGERAQEEGGGGEGLGGSHWLVVAGGSVRRPICLWCGWDEGGLVSEAKCMTGAYGRIRTDKLWRPMSHKRSPCMRARGQTARTQGQGGGLFGFLWSMYTTRDASCLCWPARPPARSLPLDRDPSQAKQGRSASYGPTNFTPQNT